MNSTPDHPDQTPPEDPGPDTGAAPDADAAPPAEGADTQSPAASEPAEAPEPGEVPAPAPPGPVLPAPEAGGGVPQAPPYAPGAQTPPSDYAYPDPGTKRQSFGAGIGIGVGVGCGAYALGAVLFLATMGVIGTIFGFLWPFILIALVAVVLMFFRKTRAVATGILIVSAAAWIIVLGPCLALMSGF